MTHYEFGDSFNKHPNRSCTECGSDVACSHMHAFLKPILFTGLGSEGVKLKIISCHYCDTYTEHQSVYRLGQ